MKSANKSAKDLVKEEKLKARKEFTNRLITARKNKNFDTTYRLSHSCELRIDYINKMESGELNYGVKNLNKYLRGLDLYIVLNYINSKGKGKTYTVLNDYSIVDFILEIMQEDNISVGDIVTKCNIPVKTVNDVLASKSALTIDVFLRLCKGLEIEIIL